MRFASGGGCEGAGVCSSASDSVRGYGEKYLVAQNKEEEKHRLVSTKKKD